MNDAIDITAMALGAIGQPVRRKEDQRLLTGNGRFTDDFNITGQTYAVMVRAPHPHARILQVDATRARRIPGVLGVFSGGDCQAGRLSRSAAKIRNPASSCRSQARQRGQRLVPGPPHQLPRCHRPA